MRKPERWRGALEFLPALCCGGACPSNPSFPFNLQSAPGHNVGSKKKKKKLFRPFLAFPPHSPPAAQRLGQYLLRSQAHLCCALLVTAGRDLHLCAGNAALAWPNHSFVYLSGAFRWADTYPPIESSIAGGTQVSSLVPSMYLPTSKVL